MILRQFLHTSPVGISYLFGCRGQASGAVVDPIGDIELYLRAAEEAGMRIRFVIDTHVHADHPSAARRLAAAEEGAHAMFASMQRLKRLPDYVEILPGAFSGSLCGRRLSGKTSSTIGFERRHNQAFAMDDAGEFVSAMLRDVPRSPVDAARLRAVNAGLAAAM